MAARCPPCRPPRLDPLLAPVGHESWRHSSTAGSARRRIVFWPLLCLGSGCLATPLDVGPPRLPRATESVRGVVPEAPVPPESALVLVRVVDDKSQIRWTVARYLRAVASRSLGSLRSVLLRQAVFAQGLEEPGQLALSVLEDQFRQQAEHSSPGPTEVPDLLVGVFSPEQAQALRGIRPLHLVPGPGQVLVTARSQGPRGPTGLNSPVPVELLLQRRPEGWRIAHILQLGEAPE